MAERQAALEGLVVVFWRGRKVFLTGHTGFKGAWLSLWLEQLGAVVTGFALAPPTQPSLFSVADVGSGMSSIEGDIRDLEGLRDAMHHAAPEVVVHMAAQSLVRASYQDPSGTYATNVMGTVHVLEAARACPSVRAILIVTSDKCYENVGQAQPFCEGDRLGGHDPYSNSKACAELVAACYRASFFARENYADHGVAIATVRAGNVIGGGDWATDRLLPDAVRAFGSGAPLRLRNPYAVRPWQHVLEPLHGYVTLARALLEKGPRADGPWNFGACPGDNQGAVLTVEAVICSLATCWERQTGTPAKWEVDRDAQPYEAQSLALDCTRAATELGWCPALSLEQSIELTAEWYGRHTAGEDGRALCCEQIAAYRRLLGSSPLCPTRQSAG